MSNLRDKIADTITNDVDWHVEKGEVWNGYKAADTILALPETAGWTALEAATEELANAEARIDELEAIVENMTAHIRIDDDE